MTKHNINIRRVLPCLFLVFLVVIGMSGTVSALDIQSASPYRELIRNYDSAYEMMYDAMYDMEPAMDLSELKIRDRDIMQIYTDIRNNSPELFYLENSLLYYYNSYGIVTSVEFSYTMPPEEVEAARIQYDAEIAYIVSLLEGSMSDMEIALFVHDYFAASFSYDNSMKVYDAYGLFNTRTGVCQAYSLAYAAVLRECGIDAVMITSEDMNHAWNLIKINGSWYHVDLSYDDPSPDRTGLVLHDNFLLSDDAVRVNHNGWESIIRCRSALYDNAYWKAVSSKMTRIDGSWYYIDEEESALVRSDYTGLRKEILYPIEDKWYVSGDTDSFWKGVFSGCANYRNHIYFNTPNEIVVFSIQNGKISTLKTNDSNKTKYYGLTVYKNTLEYMTADRPDNPNISELHFFQLTDFILDLQKITLPFEDVSRLSGYYPAVRFVYRNGIFNGVSETEFSPDTGMTRAMFVTVLGRLCQVDTLGYTETSFSDVPEGEWYSSYVEWAAKNGIVNGVGDGKFAPHDPITHEQMYKILHDCARYLGCENTEPENVLMIYVDRKQISDWAFEGIAYCHENRLIGDEFSAYLKPKKDATRAEVAELLWRFAANVLGRDKLDPV